MRDDRPDLSRRRALGAGALGVTALALPAAAVARSTDWTSSSAASTSFSGETWTFYRAGGTSSSTGLQTVDGETVLRLTDTSPGGMTGVAINSKSFPLSGGIDVRFTMSQWGFSTQGDGICFLLLDAAAATQYPGAAGGGLGYSGSGWNGSSFTTRQGIVGGLVGVGFDNYGNFGTYPFGPAAGDDEELFTYTNEGSALPWLAIRGGSSTSYALAASSDQVPTWADMSFSSSVRMCRVTVSSGGLVTVYVGAGGQFPSGSGSFGSLTQYAQVTIPGISGVANVRIGFSAATGGARNDHAVLEEMWVL